MPPALDRFLTAYDDARITRRQLLLSLPALAMASRAMAQASDPPIRVRALNHMTLAVSDPKRSVEFYQGLFGMPIQARQGATTILRIGSGPQFLAVSGTAANAVPAINHFCLTVDGFNVDRILKVLADRGLTRTDTAGSGNAGGGGSNTGPMKVRVRMRGPEAGGAREGTPELYFGDPDGIIVQLQDVSYCGGAGVLGNVCAAAPERPPKNGLLAARDLSHFTITVSDAQRSNAFYQGLFGLSIQAHQGAAPLLGVGSSGQFIMFTGGGAARGAAAATPRPPRIDHVCLNMEGFDPNKVLKALEEYGIKPRGNTPGPAPPLASYVSMRMENRGGAPGGTPELYFTDPDGILIQLQDVSYCGGGGYLGNVCG
jgi:catechol 2,3-dioxygenase-like lactoylglutathione lyase family enzyme